jgi:hypothetical protein
MTQRKPSYDNAFGIQEFAGQTVKVIGTLDAKTNTIDNASIEMAPTAKRTAAPH